MTEIDELVEQYIAEHPEYEYPPSGDKHPAILASVGPIKNALMDQEGGPLPYYKKLLEAAKIWFADGQDTREFRLFCKFFEAEGNTWWNGNPELEALAREYNAWRIKVRGLPPI